jgi:hypothetical protein
VCSLTHTLRLSTLTTEFEASFTHPAIPSLPKILSTISTSLSKQSDNHFFATVVQSKELIPLYHDVVLWMLKRDLLITLHLRIRVVATQELKMRVKMARERALAERWRNIGHRKREHRQLKEQDDVPQDARESPPDASWMSMSPKSARRHTHSKSYAPESEITADSVIIQSSDDDEGDDEANREDEDDEVGWDARDDDLLPSMINDPGRANPLQRRWLSAMSVGKDAAVARRFEQCVQAFSLAHLNL